MDIEFCEWHVLLDTETEVLNRFRIMILELHGLRRAFSKDSLMLLDACIKKLKNTHHVVHLHPNNVLAPTKFAGLEIPSLLEVTFYRKDRPVKVDESPPLPHPLDHNCVPGNPTVVVPAYWR